MHLQFDGPLSIYLSVKHWLKENFHMREVYDYRWSVEGDIFLDSNLKYTFEFPDNDALVILLLLRYEGIKNVIME